MRFLSPLRPVAALERIENGRGLNGTETGDGVFVVESPDFERLKCSCNVTRDQCQINTLDRGGSGPGGCLDGGGTIPSVVSQPPGLPQLHAEVTPKQAVVERLRRRIESYRRRQSDCMPRFDQSFSGLCEQNLQDTLHLKQRFLDAKAKRVSKTKDKKQEAIQSSVHVVSLFTSRYYFLET
ncbi:hypothetical protein GWI33_019270 [Rhynchophorus ferrugineus]|uniref:Neurogenic mastermind-like N-terminal domain-containing protein n=1 Tax=Rhynchophorus ferrugineus TaxID=354439 RepID=A0A834HYI9_RHYFE|nr:hypothetical protein GWI33_019270 [Rhynchophorus ferrugineus]